MVFSIRRNIYFFRERAIRETVFLREKLLSKFAHPPPTRARKLFSPCVIEIQSPPFVLYWFGDRFGRLWFRSTPTSCNSILNQGAWKDLESFGFLKEPYLDQSSRYKSHPLNSFILHIYMNFRSYALLWILCYMFICDMIFVF